MVIKPCLENTISDLFKLSIYERVNEILVISRDEFNFWNVHGIRNTSCLPMRASCKLCKSPEVFIIP